MNAAKIANLLYYLPKPARVSAYFGLQSLIGSKIFGVWRQFLGWETFTPEQLDHQIKQQVSKLLAHATAHCEYYRKLRLQPASSESPVEFLRRFPILKRDHLRDCFTSLIADELRPKIPSQTTPSPRKYDWLVVKTGGTTGSPTTVVHDALFRDWGRVTRIYAQRLCGFPLGTRYFRLWGSEQDLLQQKENLDRLVLRNLLGEIPMNAFRAKEAELSQQYQTLRQHPEIHYLIGYVDATANLALYLREKKLPAPRLQSIMACAGTVTPEWRQLLESTFHAEVFDKYGSRECADMACECAAHQGLHVLSPHAYIEVLDERDQPCLPGQTGRIIVTLLRNFSFPMIRYEIGDLGISAPPGTCPCGLSFPRLQSLQGRQDDMLITEEGTPLTSIIVRHFVGVSLNRQLIREWQLEQTGQRQFVFRYVPRERNGLAENLHEMEAGFRTALGKSANFRFVEVNAIPPSATGKQLWIINRMKRMTGRF